jgi:hypothetical protein
MNNKKLILNEQIKRILEVMNVDSKNSKLLTESIVDDIAQGIVRLSVKSGDDLATSISKIERQFDVPKGILDYNDITKLTKGQGKDVIIKVVNKSNPSQLMSFAKKVWVQIPEAHIAATNVVDGLVTAKKTYTTNNLLKYLNDMSETVITSPVKELDPLVKSLREIFVDNSYASLKTKGIIDDVAGSAGKTTTKVSDDVNMKIDEIIDATLNDKSIKEVLPGMSDADLNLIRESIRSKYGKMSYDEISSDFMKVREDFISSVQKMTNSNGEEVLVKVQDGKKFEFKDYKWIYDNKITRMCVGKSSYMNSRTGTMVDKMDPKFLKMGQCALGIWALSELINQLSSKPNEREFIACKPIALVGGFCGSDFQVKNNLCVKSCGGGTEDGPDNQEVNGNFSNDFSGCMNWAKTKGKRCDQDGSGGYVIYDKETPNDITPVKFDDGNWVEI